MTSTAITLLLAQAQHPHRRQLLRLFLSMGMLGLFLLSAIDASFIPLPLPGASDLLLMLLAARSHAWLLLALVATAGSAVGGSMSYHLGLVGGMAMLETRVSKRYLDRITRWASEHAIFSVALPAILPPPLPLMPFTIAAGAMRMPRRKFYISFLSSRFLRHAIFGWLGVHYGPHILRLWNTFAEKWGVWILSVLWAGILFGAIYGIRALIKTNSEQKRPQTVSTL